MTEREPAGRATWEGEMFRLLAENVKDYAIFVMDPGGRVLSWSKGAERLLGFTEAEILGQQSDRFFTPEDVRRGVPRQELEQALRTGRGEDDRWHLRKDGSRFWAGGVVTPLKDGGGALRGFAKIMRDRTELKLAAEAALERERQLQLLTDRAPVLIAHCDSGQRFQFVNKPYAGRFGLHPRDVVGRTIREVLGGPAYAAIEGHVRDALAGERVEFEVEVPYDGQEPQVMRCSYDPEFDDDGKVRGFVAAIVNVTQGRRMGDALRESEERLRNLSDNLPDGAVYQVVGEQDGRRQFTHVSAGVERMFGVSPAEVLADANSLYGLVHEEDRQRVAAEEEAALRGLAAFDCEFRSWTRSGDIVWLHCRSAPRRLPTGQLAWEGVVMDVTARKLAQGQLVASQRRLQSLFDNTLDAVLLADDQARYVDANPAACTLLGYGRDELLRRTVFDITPPPDAEAGRAAWENFLREGRKAGEFAVARGDGTRVVVEFRAVANVQPGLHLSVLRDVTERVQLLQQVRAERERLAEVFQQAPSFMCVLRGPDHVFERANDRYLQLVGHRELLGKPVRDAFPEIEGQGFFEMLDRVYTTGEPVAGSDMRIALVRQPGQPPEERYLDFVYQPTRDPDGAVTGILAQGVDLTERRRAQEALARLTAESERQRRLYETALSNTIDFNYTFDLDGRFTYVNKALLDLWARESHETVGKNFVELGYPPALAERLQRQIRQVIETRQPLRDETPYTSAAGEREYEYIFVPVLGAGGAVEAVAGSTRDITERKQAEQALRESEQRFARFMQHLPGLAWIKDAQGRYVYANAAAERAFRTPRARLYGKTDEEVFDPDTAARFRENDRSALAGGAGVQAVETLEQEDGLRHHSLVSKFPIPGPDGQTLVGGVAIDITDRLRAEESLREADRRKDEFLATLAHELRNPLAPIRNSLQILKLPRVDAATAERSREMMERQVHHLVRLVDDLLDVSRVMRGKIDLRKEVVELASVVARAAETAQPLIEAQRQQFTIDLPPESLPLNADPVRLAQVVGNLLTNATKYTDPGGRIALKARREGEQVVLSVRDTGIGIAPEMMPKIFDLFVQVDHAAMRSQGGLGIGLTLVKNLVEMHGGAIEARSAGLGHGSEFVVRLPLSHQERQGPGDGEPQETTHPAGRKVLVIDDNRDAADSLAMLLRLHGHEVRVAHDGPAALDVAGVYQPEVVFVDIGMPGMNGYEVARRMRQEPHLRGTVLVALTGWGQPEDRRRSAEAGFDHHMVKPAEPGALEALLARVGRPTQ